MQESDNSSTNRSVLLMAFGRNDDVFKELRFHLLRFLATHPDRSGIRYIIYTDRPHAFDDFRELMEVETVDFGEELRDEWLGPAKFFWRIKVQLVRDAAERFGGSQIYCDTDTYPRRDLTAIFEHLEAGGLVMYEDEGPLTSPEFVHYRRRFSKHPDLRSGNRHWTFPLTTRLWNAGVIGHGPNQADLLDDVLALCDALYDAWGFVHIEQFAFGHTWQYSPQGCDAAIDDIFHYWRVRDYSKLIDHFFEYHRGPELEELAPLSGRMLAEHLLAPRIAYEEGRPLQPLWMRYPHTMKRIFPRGWDITTYSDLAE